MLFSCIHGSTKVITRVKGMVPYLHNIAVEECHSCKTVQARIYIVVFR